MSTPTANEQLLLEYVNDARLDPLGDAARYISGYGTVATSADADINSALRYFGVSGPAYLQAVTALTPVAPLAWSEALGNSAQAHDSAMIAADSQTHQAPGEADLGSRLTSAGYNFRAAGENVYAYATSAIDAHAGFMVDWGNGPNGMQSPAGHRDNLMSGTFREIGIAVVHESSPTTQVGPEVVTQDMGMRSTTGAFVLGVAYADTDGNDFYSLGEGQAGLNVTLGGTSVTGYSTGGYTLQTSASGAQTVTFTGAGLSGPVSVALNLPSGSNVKLDIVSGIELKTSTSVVVSGPIAKIEAIGVQGLSLAGTGGGQQTIQGGAGADTVTGGGGQTYLRGGAGNDVINGGAGFDDANGNIGNDTIHGNGGDDWSVGGKDNDQLFGDAGADVVWGNLGNDTCDGGDGADQVRGGQGNDSVSGGAGNDYVSGDRGDDTISGGAGADLFHGSQDAGIDRVLDFHQSEGDRVMLDPGTTYTVSQVGSDTVIDMGAPGQQMVMVGVQMSGLAPGWIFLG